MTSFTQAPKFESESVEFKKTLAESEDIVRTVVAFANRRGGEVWIGIAPDGKVLGIQLGATSLEQLSNKIKAKTSPPLYPEIGEHTIEGKKVLLLRVLEGSRKPYLADGKGYIRVGRSNSQMGRDEFERLLLDNLRGRTQFDTEVSPRFTLNDISESAVRWYVGRLRNSGRYEYVKEEMPVFQALEKLGVLLEMERDSSGNIISAQVTNAGVLMFSREPQRFLLQSEVRCARFRGTQPIDFIDMKVLRGTLTFLKFRAMKFVENNIRYSSNLVGSERHERWEYPLAAINEAIVNALIHRDYYSTANVQLSIFDDRLEIWNPGGLPPGLTIAALSREHQSIPRNPLLAQLFFHIRYVERWGRGTIIINEQAKNHGLPPPVFEQRNGSFLVVFRRPQESP